MSEAYLDVKSRIPAGVKLVAVSKTYFAADIEPVLKQGQTVFGENRVQEAYEKWPALRQHYPDIELHLIGPLQSNKAAEAVGLFDVIQTVDREKIAIALAKEAAKQARKLSYFIQVNIGQEPQKAGIAPDAVDQFVADCKNKHGLNIIGLMCIPPANDDPQPYFTHMAKLAHRNKLKELSMGMSADYALAINAGASVVRVGSAIFGAR
jgi:PLP dependent protein